ncbi:MAG: DUF2267 domain-containing protein [Proteobacteria bacterium]|nr:DUF2267 domain-containing protein [Pseudomonadota bacterium]
MIRPHVFEAHVETANAWLDQVIESLELMPVDRVRALHALRAGLHAIRDRLPAAEVVDLGAQLPTLVRGLYYEGWRLANDPGVIRDRAAMVERVRRELRPDPRLDPVDVLRATIELLVAYVSPGEILDVLATLPSSISTLWHDLTGHALHDREASIPTTRTT